MNTHSSTDTTNTKRTRKVAEAVLKKMDSDVRFQGGTAYHPEDPANEAQVSIQRKGKKKLVVGVERLGSFELHITAHTGNTIKQKDNIEALCSRLSELPEVTRVLARCFGVE